MAVSSTVQALADLIRLVTREELPPRHGQLRADQIHQHSDGSLFTEADLRSEARLTDGACIIWPGVIASGEEDISENPAHFLRMTQQRDVIIFDPIDGTGAFERGEDTYGVMGAYIRNGVTLAGVIYTPGHAVKQGDGTLAPAKDIMICAEKGAGCFGGNIRLSLQHRTSCLDDARIAFACRNQDKAFEAVLAQGLSGYTKRNNSSYDYTRLLFGDTDATFYSEGFTKTGLGKCPPWDHAAGVLAVQESGGVAGLPYGASGQPYSPLYCHDRLLVCANQDLFDSVLRHIRSRTPALCAPRPQNAAGPTLQI
jgi:fructose-1,6-bisphosphatase/inositol monophosphatase family enzyme